MLKQFFFLGILALLVDSSYQHSVIPTEPLHGEDIIDDVIVPDIRFEEDSIYWMDSESADLDHQRNPRSIIRPKPIFPRIPNPHFPPGPVFPYPHPIFPTRHVRDIQFPGIKKPTHRDIIIPNWNPNVHTQPWQSLGVKTRRSAENFGMIDNVEIEDVNIDSIHVTDTDLIYPEHHRNPRSVIFPKPIPLNPHFPNPHLPTDPFFPYPHGTFPPRHVRDIQIPGIKKPHRDNIIPTLHYTQPWRHVGVKTRRSAEDFETIDPKEDEVMVDSDSIYPQNFELIDTESTVEHNRKARDVIFPEPIFPTKPSFPSPYFPTDPYFPTPRPIYPTRYVRDTRGSPGIVKPTRRVTIDSLRNYNPNIISKKPRHPLG